MKIALHTSGLSPHPLEVAVETCAAAGYAAVELAVDISESNHFAAHSATEADVQSLKSLMSRNGLSLVAIDIGGWDRELCVVNFDESQRHKALEHVTHAIAVAGELGCRLLTSHLWGLPAERARAEVAACRELFLASVGELVPILEKSRVRLNYMPHPGGFIEGSDGTVDLIREVGSPAIGYTFGTGHCFVINRPGQTVAKMICYAGETLTHVLISDSHHVDRIIAPPEVKAHEHMRPGRGDVDFGAIFGALEEIGFAGALSVQLISERDRITEAAISTRDFLNKFGSS